MFLRRQEPLPLSEACLHSLCASLNAPVVRVPELPTGPARAAIVIYAEEYGNYGLAVALRSLESAGSALYGYRGRIQAADEIPAAVEDALSFAEGLGFLFDDDMIEQDPAGGRRRALEHWERLLGEGEVWTHASVAEPPTPEFGADPMSDDDDLLPPMDDLLQPAEDLIPLESDDLGPAIENPRVATPPAAASVGASPEAGDGLPLTKFRGPDRGGPSAGDAGPASPPPVAGARAKSANAGASVEAAGREGQALGRVAIVKMRRDGDPSKMGLLTRLLGGF